MPSAASWPWQSCIATQLSSSTPRMSAFIVTSWIFMSILSYPRSISYPDILSTRNSVGSSPVSQIGDLRIIKNSNQEVPPIHSPVNRLHTHPVLFIGNRPALPLEHRALFHPCTFPDNPVLLHPRPTHLQLVEKTTKRGFNHLRPEHNHFDVSDTRYSRFRLFSLAAGLARESILHTGRRCGNKYRIF